MASTCWVKLTKLRTIETVSIAEPLETGSLHTPYLGQIWHSRVGQLSILTCLISSASVYSVTLVGKICQNVAIATKFSHFGGLLCPPLYQSGPIWQQTVYPRSTLTRQISFESVYCVTFQGQKRVVGHILTLGAPVPSPLTDMGQILRATADPRCTLTCQISSRSVNYVALWRRKPPNFAGVFGVRHFVMSPIGGVRRKLNVGAQL